MSPIVYFALGFFFLVFVLFEIMKRIKKKPLALTISERENNISELTEQEKKKKEYNSFVARAERVNWKVTKSYQPNIFMIFTVLGGILAFLFSSILFIIGGVVAGMFYPFYQLNKREEAFQNELPLRAEQAINAVEQQLHADIPMFEALKNAVPYMQEPLKSEYQRAVDLIEKGGIPLQRAVEDIPMKLKLSQLEYFHMILEVASETEEKAIEIIRDASDVLRRQQKHINRYNQETIDSKKEMKFMYVLLVVMVLSFVFLLPDQVPMANTPIHRVLDVIVLGGAAFLTWSFSKKIQASNLF